jgi:hypothetical protein
MVYSQKLVACIKVDGQILREDRDTVTIPFGSEYSLYLKNLNSVRVQVKVTVDGQDATEGTWLIIQPNSSIELERFIKGGNLNRGNRFKFIERTGKIEKHRGIGGEDGLIRIEYQTEKILPKPVVVPVVHYDYYYRPYWWPSVLPPSWWGTDRVYGGVRYVCNNAPLNLGNVTPSGAWDNLGGLISKTTTSGSLGSSSFLGNVNCNNASFTSSDSFGSARFTKSSGSSRSMKSMSMMRSVNVEEQANDAGITVAGSESNQQFHWASGFPVHETSDVLVLKLRGSVGGQKVVKAVTVKTKPVCATCGKKNHPTVKFCAECGTSLVLI